eukprot:2389831-Prymnesium_polylepis.1
MVGWWPPLELLAPELLPLEPLPPEAPAVCATRRPRQRGGARRAARAPPARDPSARSAAVAHQA